METLPVQGKTYNLFDKDGNTDIYYRKIKEFADEQIYKFDSAAFLLAIIQQLSKNKRKLKKHLSKKYSRSEYAKLIRELYQTFHSYTLATEQHLKGLPLWKLRDNRLGTIEVQYHLFMLEIELFNRLNRVNFLQADHKIALLPHCLRDLSKKCKSEQEGFDVVCKSCSKECFINDVSEVLKDHHIHPYIWIRSDFKKLGKQLKLENKTLGILGIACIPELIAGLRKCQKYKIPALGIPLNANRCARWFGEFYPTSVDTNQLKNLLMK